MKPLTPKQQAFVNEYLVNMNATQAAIRAGYSEKTAYAIGEQNLKKLEIKEVITAAMEERSINTKITAENVLKRISEVTEKAISEGNYSAAIRGLELLAKHLGLLKDKAEPEREKITVVLQNFSSSDKKLDS